MQELTSKAQSICRDDFMDMIMYQTARRVLAVMKSDEAVLLSKIYNDFIANFQAQSKNTLYFKQRIPVILAVAGFCHDYTHCLGSH